MRVKANSKYFFYPVPIDRINARAMSLFKLGDHVRVINLYGCPPANTMGLCYIVPADAKKDDKGHWDKEFAMVCCNSLEKKQVEFTVHCSNIGYVYRGTSPAEADKAFDEYKEQSDSGKGRAGGETVTMFWNGEAYKEHEGVLHSVD